MLLIRKRYHAVERYIGANDNFVGYFVYCCLKIIVKAFQALYSAWLKYGSILVDCLDLYTDCFGSYHLNDEK